MSELNNEEWINIATTYKTYTERVWDIHNMLQHHFGLQNRRQLLEPFETLYKLTHSFNSSLDNMIYLDYHDKDGNLKEGKLSK